MNIRHLCVIGLPLAVGLLLAVIFQQAIAQSSAPIQTRDSAGNGLLTLSLSLSPNDPVIDPSQVGSSEEFFLVNQMFDGLFRVDDTTGEVIPELATSWDLSPAGTVITVTMRNDAVWSDGNPVTAHDVRYGILRSLDPATGGFLYYILFPIQNAFEYWSGTVTDPNLVGVTALDSTHIRFDFTGPAAHLLSILANPVAKPLPEWAITANPGSWTEPGNIVTSGPYHLTGWSHGISMTIEKEPLYFDHANVQIQKVEFSMLDPSDAWDEYIAGNLDSVEVPLPEWFPGLSDPLLQQEFHGVPVLCTYYYGINTSKPPFDNPLVRQAFLGAINKSKIVQNVLMGAQLPARTYTAPGIFGHVDGFAEDVGVPFNPYLAQTKLAAAGYPGGQGLPPISLVYNTSQAHELIAQVVRQEWIENLGVTVQLEDYSFPDFLNLLATDPPQIWRLGWCADYPDAYNFLYETIVPQSFRFGNWSNTTYQSLLSQATLTTDPATRKDLYKQAEKILVETDAILIPVYFYGTGYATKPYLDRTHGAIRHGRIADWGVTSVSASIGTGGGSLTSHDGSTTIALPPGAVTDTISLTQSPAFGVPPGGNLAEAGYTFDVTAVYSSTGQAANLAAGQTYTLTVTYDDQVIGPAIESTLSIYYWNGAQWIEEPGVLDTGNNSVMATPSHFSVWAVIGETMRVYLPLTLR